MKNNYIFLFCLAFATFSANAQPVNYLSVPGFKELAKIDPAGHSVLPS
jgi:hypothetical protein